jgi:quinol monooxygenase YgiN
VRRPTLSSAITIEIREPVERSCMSFVLVLRIKVAEGNDERVAEVIPELAKATGEEPGCELYIPCCDSKDARSYLFYEQYRDKAAFEEHGASEHFQRLGAGELFGLMESRERLSFETVVD